MPRFRKQINREGKQKFWLISLLSGMIALQLACGFLARREDDQISSTISALRAQQTDLAETLAAFTAAASKNPSTQIAQSTLDASLATATAQAVLMSTLSGNPIPPASSSEAYPGERTIKSARILLFEDMSASRYIRIVKEALDKNGYFYQDVGSAKGWLKSLLLSDVEWDLVIAAAEAEREFGGEFFEYIDNRISSGAAAIVENWDFDLAPSGKAGRLLSRCGVRFQSDWYEPQMRVLFWLAPESPFLRHPNEINSPLRNSAAVWQGDLGDLLAVDKKTNIEGGDPILLAGLNPNWKDSHGVLVSCLGGRVILQTFRTHEYHHDEMLKLWENYIYQTLSNYFIQSGKTPPTPAALPTAVGETTPTPFDLTPGPEYLFAHSCGDLFQVRFTNAPVYQTDLFEHHTLGQFLILKVQIQSKANFPIMIWDGDYAVKAQDGDRVIEHGIDSDATGYLFIQNGGNLVQGIIQPGETWNLSLAFDVHSRNAPWAFVFQPGSEFDGALCETKIEVNR